MSYLLETLKNYRGRILLGQGFKLLEAVIELYLPLVMASLVDAARDGAASNVLWQKAGLLALLAVLGIIAALICQWVAARGAVRFGSELRKDLFEQSFALSHAQVEGLGADSLLTRLTSDVRTLQDAFAMLIRLVARAPFLMIGSLVMALTINLRLALVFLVTTPVIVALMWFVLRISAQRFKVLQRAMDEMSRTARESLSAFRFIRAFNLQDDNTHAFDAQAKAYARMGESAARLTASLSPATFIVMNLGLVVVLAVGAGEVMVGRVTPGVLIALITYLSTILLQTRIVANLAVLYTKAAVSARRVDEVMALTPSVADVRWQQEEGAFDFFADDALAFFGVSLSYGPGKAAVDDLSFALKRGGKLGIVGGTGSGKSSVASLIMRLYDPTEGHIVAFNQPIRHVPLQMLRAAVAYVPQQVTLLSGSVRDNLSFGIGKLTDEELWQALRVAQAEDVVLAMPGGLDALLTEGGRNLSGGQRQRLSIARAVARRPRLLILDDATSALDYRTEANLRQALQDSLQDCALIMITQRVHSLRGLDNILVMDEGRAVGFGNHQALMADCPVYRDMAASQLREDA